MKNIPKSNLANIGVFLTVLIFSIMATNCVFKGETVRAYEGTDLSPDSLAELDLSVHYFMFKHAARHDAGLRRTFEIFVDGQSYGKGLEDIILLKPGRHTVRVIGEVIPTYWGKVRPDKEVTLEFEAEPGNVYRFKYEFISGKSKRFWIQKDNSKEVVSNVEKMIYTRI